MEGETTTPTPTTQSPIGSNWPSLPIPGDTTEHEISQDSPIQPAQKSPTAWKGQQRGPEEHEANRVGRFAKYFKGNEILPIPEIADKIAPRVLSLVVSDLKTKRLVGLTKEAFEEQIRKAGIPCQYFCRKSFATWDVLLPTEKQAAKVAESDVITKNFRLQPEYKGTRRLRVTVCNVPAIITGEVLAAYLSAYGQVEESNLLRSSAGTAYGDYAFRLCLTRDGFKAIPEMLISGDRQMMVMVEGRRPRCWGCKQIGHIAKFCPQRPENKASTSTTTTTTKDAAAPTITKEAEAKGPGQVQPQNNQEGWTEVTKKRRGSPKQGGEKSPSPPQKQTRAQAVAAAEPAIAAAAAVAAAATTTTRTPAEATATKTTATTTTTVTKTTATTEQQTAAAAKKPKKTATPKKPATPKTPTAPSPKKKKTTTKTYEEMETSTNLKRRRDSGEGAAKKLCPGKTPPEAGPSSQPSPPVPSPLSPLPSPTFPPPKITLPSPPQQMAPLSPQQELFLKKHYRPYKIPLPRSQSAERAQPSGLARTPSLPSLSPTDFSSQELFPAMISPKTKPQTEKRKHTQELTIGQMQRAAALCSAELEAVGDFQLRKALKPLARLEKIHDLKVSNPTNFRSAAMVTTFVRSAGDRTKGVWKYLSTVCQTDTGIKLAELEHSSLKKCITYCAGRVPILVHPSLYRALKLKFPIDVGGITRDNRVTTELGTGSLRQAVGILTPKDFRPVVDDE